jgi:hypothetical protein
MGIFNPLSEMGPDPSELAMPPAAVESVAWNNVKGNCVWGWFDYIMAWTKHEPVPPLVTTGPSSLFATGGIPGALGQPGTVILFGGTPLTFGQPTSGLRGDIGIWLDHDNHCSLDVGGFYLPRQFDRFGLASNAAGSPTITRPFFNTATGTEDVIIDALPGNAALFIPALASGAVNVTASQLLWGLDLNARYNAYPGRFLHAEALMGIRYVRLVEDLDVADFVTPFAVPPGGPTTAFTFLGQPVPTGSQIFDQDSFRTSNQFIGFQLGGRLNWDFGRWFVGLNGKAAVGATQQQVQINGVTTVSGLGTAPGGVLALPSNIGNHERTEVSFLPEVGIDAGVNLTRWCRIHAGYSFLFWTDVVRPGDQIDTVVNTGQLPTAPNFGTSVGPARPAFAFHDSNFWVQYLNIGVELHF